MGAARQSTSRIEPGRGRGRARPQRRRQVDPAPAGRRGAAPGPGRGSPTGPARRRLGARSASRPTSRSPSTRYLSRMAASRGWAGRRPTRRSTAGPSGSACPRFRRRPPGRTCPRAPRRRSAWPRRCCARRACWSSTSRGRAWTPPTRDAGARDRSPRCSPPGGSVLVSDHRGEIVRLPGARRWTVADGTVSEAAPSADAARRRGRGRGAGRAGRRHRRPVARRGPPVCGYAPTLRRRPRLPPPDRRTVPPEPRVADPAAGCAEQPRPRPVVDARRAR